MTNGSLTVIILVTIVDNDLAFSQANGYLEQNFFSVNKFLTNPNKISKMNVGYHSRRR